MNDDKFYEYFSKVRDQIRTDKDLYLSRDVFNLQNGEVMAIHRRFTIDTKIGRKKSEFDFCYHVWFDRHGTVWYLINPDEQFPRIGHDVKYFGTDDEYDWASSCRDRSYYIFKDLLIPNVRNALKKLVADEQVTDIYVWPLKIAREKLCLPEGTRTGMFSVA